MLLDSREKLLNTYNINLFVTFCLAIQIIDDLLTRYTDARLHEGMSVARLKKMTRCMRLLENVSNHDVVCTLLMSKQRDPLTENVAVLVAYYWYM